MTIGKPIPTRLSHDQYFKTRALLESWQERIERERLNLETVRKELESKLPFGLTAPQVRNVAKDIGIRWHAGQAKSRVNKEIAKLYELMDKLSPEIIKLSHRITLLESKLSNGQSA